MGSGPIAAPVPSEYGGSDGPPQACKGAENLEAAMQFLRRAGTNHCIILKSQEDWTNPAMNAPSEMNFEDMMRVRLEVLRREHRDLDEAVHVLETAGRPDPLTLRRLKKQKLALKDQIVKMEDRLIPDIIA
jgi:hypothetical protein